MTLQEIKALVVRADPDARHYFSESRDRDYTYWEETRRLPALSDDTHEEAWRFYVHRFTRDEFDPVARRIFEVLDADDRVSVSEDRDTEDGGRIIHYIFECEAV